VKNTKKKTILAPVNHIASPESRVRRFPLRELVAGVVAVVFLVGIFAFLKLPKADIEIWPKTDTLTLSEKVTATTLATAQDAANNIIPAQYVELEKEATQEFPATGSASNDGKATGTITVYNKISPAAPFTLIKGTHFLSNSGKYFVTTVKIVIPPAKKNVPGQINVQVQAEDSGTDYNIGPSKFSIPKLNGTPYYYSIYGQSTSAMSGGYTGNVKKVTDDDIATAKDVVAKKILQDAKDALKAKVGSGDVLLDGAYTTVISESKSNVKAGVIADTFNQSAKIKISALVFKKQDLEIVLKNNILSQLSSDKSFLENSLQTTYNLASADIKNGKLVLDLQSSATTYFVVNTDDLMDLVGTRSSSQIKSTIDQLYPNRISEAKVNFWPFWVNRAPGNKNRIKIDLHLE
jgi:hypothetical protein